MKTKSVLSLYYKTDRPEIFIDTVYVFNIRPYLSSVFRVHLLLWYCRYVNEWILIFFFCSNGVKVGHILTYYSLRFTAKHEIQTIIFSATNPPVHYSISILFPVVFILSMHIELYFIST